MWFDTVKPVKLIEGLISHFSKNAIILDSFAWSGTTAHAVLNLNKRDGWNRKFILVEMEDYAETITAERVRRVIGGYGDTEGTGGGFSLYSLGDELLDRDGNLNGEASIEDIRQYIIISETRGAEMSYESGTVDHPYFLMRTVGRDHYFYYEREQLTILDRDFLDTIVIPQDSYTIWADKCSFSRAELDRLNIAFKKIPRDIRKI